MIDLNASLDYYTSDEAILPVFSQIIGDRHNRSTFVVIHCMGSHFRYNLRYPEEFQVFTPVIDNSFNFTALKPSNRDRLINSYDNSILFTDYFLSELISILSRDSTRSNLLMYASDHGENLFDDELNLFAHGGTVISRYERKIPFFIWRNQLYDEFYPDKIDAIIEHRDSLITTGDIFHSILDIADIRIDEETEYQSFANRAFRIKR